MSDKIIVSNMDIKSVRELLIKATGGKFRLSDKESFEKNVEKVKLSASDFYVFEINEDKDIFNIRHKLQELIKKSFQIEEKKLYNILLVFTELATNIIKHAIKGVVEVYISKEGIYILFRDQGEGIDIEKIPYIALSNYSSMEDSLGFGFTICINMCDFIDMETSKEGTNILVYIRI